MEQVLRGCTPSGVFSFFEQITAIPRGSGHEEQIADYLEAFAAARGLSCRRDAMNNIFIRKPATEGYENAPTVMLQGHMDMVCEKRSDSRHDFTKAGPALLFDNGIIHADGTTLGADDGIAVAMILAILDDAYLPHPALECLLTVQEEIGLNGAVAFDYSDCRASLLINIDSEDEGVATVSCAGGVRCDITRTVRRDPCGDRVLLAVTADGFAGGHSGMDIDKGRTNAIRTLGCLLLQLREELPFAIVRMDGGAMDNAIARSCTCVLAVAREDRDACTAAIERFAAQRRSSFSPADENASFTVSMLSGTDEVMTADATDALLHMIVLIPNGIIRMSRDIPQLVETSANLGVVRTTTDQIALTSSARSSVDDRKHDVMAVYRALAASFGAVASFRGDYPGWAYQKESVSRARYIAAYRSLSGKEPRIEAIHAGLECGIIKNHLPHIDPISIGPDMRNVHTPDETLDAASVSRVYQTILLMLRMKEEETT